ncbi:SDR family oxidoreductase [Ureibacillus aquaedulcis]|uniref:SDR family oxidoreductase n=1 Tax=Ureibacillus aquaedulcis TaxID=3058421 RepID=A0ABT8GSN1_9BACL|nr:SDR family oxidoreductase [Ureibacillus sp. BA0131]MDN4494421.1 SDR family oxidoreductase [Ureibacillus sp. BA0131]
MRILVTGSTGQLGTALLSQLRDCNYQVKITSRRKPESMEDFNWVYSDLLSGEGLDEAVKDVDVIIHAATSPTKKSEAIELTGFGNFLSKAQHIQHFIYPSIVGIEDIPFKYYRLKYEAERLLKNSNIPYTIARATQFHSFVENLLLSKPLFNRYVIPGKVKFQSVDVGEYAGYLTDLVNKGPQGKAGDFCGPEILTLKEMAELKIKINNEKNNVLSIPLAGKLYSSLIEGKNTNSMEKIGEITFEEYLRSKLID